MNYSKNIFTCRYLLQVVAVYCCIVSMDELLLTAIILLSDIITRANLQCPRMLLSNVILDCYRLYVIHIVQLYGTLHTVFLCVA